MISLINDLNNILKILIYKSLLYLKSFFVTDRGSFLYFERLKLLLQKRGEFFVYVRVNIGDRHG